MIKHKWLNSLLFIVLNLGRYTLIWRFSTVLKSPSIIFNMLELMYSYNFVKESFRTAMGKELVGTNTLMGLTKKFCRFDFAAITRPSLSMLVQ